MTARERRRAQTESEIVDAAMGIVVDHGMAALTIGRIAKRIDYTPGALYRYFPSKDAIIAELHRRAVEEIAQLARQRLDQVPVDCGVQVAALARIVVVSEAYIDFSTTHRGPFRLVAMSLAEPQQLVGEEHAGVAIPAYLSLYALVATLFQEASASGALTTTLPVQDLTVAFALALQGPLQVAKLEVHAPAGLVDAERLARSVVDALLMGWGADPTQLAQARA